MKHYMLVRRGAAGCLYRFACELHTGWHARPAAGDWSLDRDAVTCVDCWRIVAFLDAGELVRQGYTTRAAAGLA